MNTQYTIRTVPPAIDRARHRRAKQEDKSLSDVAVEALTRGLELNAKPVEHTDLEARLGSWQEDPAVDRAFADCSGLLLSPSSTTLFFAHPTPISCLGRNW